MIRSFTVRAAVIAAIVASTILVAGPAHAAFPGADGRLIFESPTVTGCCDLFTIRPDGSGLEQLTHFSPAAAAVQPAWSPDSAQVVFRTPDDALDPGRLWVMNADGAGQHPITATAGIYEDPHYTADGTRIVFSQCRDDVSACALFSITVNGTHRTRITAYRPGVFDFDPHSSPDGKLISFSSFNRGGLVTAVYTVHPDGTNTRRVTPAAIEGFQADWTPDGHALAFSSNAGSPLPSAIWSIQRGSGQLTKLSHPGTSAADFKPVYSPTGKWIAFERSSNGSPYPLRDIWIMRAGGSQPHLLRVNSDHVSWGSAP